MLIRLLLTVMLLMGMSSISLAETLNAIPESKKVGYHRLNIEKWFSSTSSVCTDWAATAGMTSPKYVSSNSSCTGYMNGTLYSTGSWSIEGGTMCYSEGGPSRLCGLACPDSSWTLNGSVCTRPDCPYGRDAITGQCQGKCEAGAGVTSSAWYVFGVGSDPNGAYCVNGCQVQMQADSGQPVYYTNGKKNRVKMNTLTVNAECTDGRALPVPSTAAESPPVPPKEPECAAGEGVLSSSTGKVHCVPSSVPDAPKPRVQKESQTQNFPDGSQKKTDTITTTDPETGVSDRRQTVTNTPKTGGGAGEAGTPGTSSGSSSSSTSSNGSGVPDGSGNSDFCSKNPGLQICKGGMNEEATQKKVFEAGEKIRDSLSAENFDPATHLPATINPSADAKNKLDQAKDSVIVDVQKFGTASDPSKGFYDTFKDNMNGWLGEIPVTGCTPFQARIGPYDWRFDHCEKALKIAEIFGYCLWVMLALGVFSLATRNRGGN